MQISRLLCYTRVALFAAAILLPIIAGILYVSSDDEALLVIKEDRIVAEGSRGSEVVLEVTISNRGEVPVRVLGAATDQTCTLTGCAKDAPDLPMELMAHESKTTRVLYRIGPRDTPPYILTIYTDSASQPTLEVTIRNKSK